MPKPIRQSVYDSIDANLDMLQNLIYILNDIKQGKPIAKACRDYDINVNTFRAILCNPNLGYKEADTLPTNDFIPATLSPEEHLWCEVMGDYHLSHIPSNVDHAIQQALNVLTKKERAVIRMRYWELLTYEECATYKHTAIATMRRCHERAIHKLRRPNVKKYLCCCPCDESKNTSA